ncbi:hypothetical protein DDE74_21375 [Streptomyces lydicus]|uniref:Uncharacterized protein n=1 Tax=Streptomyces lydicus TaxID=47763 RepID=A0A3Q9K7M5_9ACTN|nr:hypothetical protein [Streptomyces lydicus]AZS73164.1 hypothetical protein DDE74_21375 [Streptomyces lydicus]
MTDQSEPDETQWPAPELRLLPWETPVGNPCYLSTDDSGGYLSRKADEMEAEQMREAAAVLADAEKVLDDPTAGPLTLRVTLQQTTRALGDVRRIAASRGGRLPVPDDLDADG